MTASQPEEKAGVPDVGRQRAGARQGQTLIEVRDLRTYFYMDEGVLKAVDGVDLSVEKGRTLGLVGESGCGKSVTAQSIMRIVPVHGRTEGRIRYFREGGEPVDLAKLDASGGEMRAIRGKDITMIFQEPMTSFSPLHTVGFQIMEALLLHRTPSKVEAREITLEMLARVGIPAPPQRIDEYPHQLSGGMRQRAMIAMALSCNPALLIADEPTTALDVTVQAQVIDLMLELREQYGMALLYITHDLGVIAEMADDVAVMYLGKVAELADVDAIFHDPRHPYTRALLKSIPKLTDPDGVRLESIRGAVPIPIGLPPSCPFHERCEEHLDDACRSEPRMVEVSKNHFVRCHMYQSYNSEPSR